MNYADRMNAPRIDPFSAEAEAPAMTVEANEAEAIRAGIAAIIAQRDLYYGQLSELQRQMAELRDFLRSVGTVRNL